MTTERPLGTAATAEIGDDLAREVAWLARCVGRGDWAPLGEAQLAELSSHLSLISVRAGEPIFRQGDAPEAIWIVREGRVELSVRTSGRKLVVQIWRPGDVDGDIQLILDVPMQYSARAMDDARLLKLAAPDFERLIASDPPLARRWLSSVAERLVNTERRILQLATHDLRAQVARLLLDEAWEGRVELAQATLAALLAVRRPSLNKVLRELETGGALELSYRRIQLLDEARLRALAGPTYPA